MTAICIFCLRQPGDQPWCPDNPGHGCTYGCGHEYPTIEKPATPPKRVDVNRCTKCDLHRKNPLSQSNGCAHDYGKTKTPP